MPRRVHALTLTMIALALVYLGLDWSRLLRDTELAIHPISNLAKVLSSLAASLIAWTAGRGALDEADAVAFRRMFTLVFVADVCFMFPPAVPVGIVLFLIFQGLLSARNLAGARGAWRSGRLGGARGAVTLLGVGAVIGAYLAVLSPRIPDGPLTVVIPVYFAALWISVSAGLLGHAIGARPPANTARMALGLGLFAACDMTVGFNLVFDPNGREQIWSSSLTWMFYAPALWCIATSAYRRG